MKLTSILLDESITSDYKTTETDNALANLSKINIFIGANNSGKSRLMRTLFANNEFQYKLEGSDLNDLNHLVRSLHDELAEVISTAHHTDIPVSIPILFSYATYSYFTYENLIGYKIENMIGTLNSWDSFYYYMNENKYTSSFYNFTQYGNGKNIRERYELELRELTQNLEANNIPFSKTYIPILRGLRPIHSSSSDNTSFSQNDNYLHRTIFDYFKEEKKANKLLSISTGLNFYDQLSHLKNGDVHEQDLVKEFETFLSKTFFQNEPIVITPHKRKDVVTFRIGNGEAHPIYDLGDGIQAIILLTYSLFFNKGKDMIFFFEEPEIYLHPGFQRIFIDTLLSPRFESFQYFFTTHSNHFLDITLDHDNISIYNFRKQKSSENKFEIENVQSGDISLLEELGVRNASVFLSNCTIWVEGITDRIYIRKYLEMLMNTEGSYFREDYHYSFVEYGGNNITHWSFLDSEDANYANINVDRICKRIFLITDQDGAGEAKDGVKVEKEKKQKRQEQLKAKLGADNYHCLDCREIENALSYTILQKVITGRKKGKGEHSFKGDWSKKDYLKEKLGDFIEKNIEGDYFKINDSGTIHNKLDFAKNAVAAISSFDDLSESAKKLTEQIYAFIKKSNE
jgi:AAA15 family ATPase/GTPase